MKLTNIPRGGKNSCLERYGKVNVRFRVDQKNKIKIKLLLKISNKGKIN